MRVHSDLMVWRGQGIRVRLASGQESCLFPVAKLQNIVVKLVIHQNTVWIAVYTH